MRRYPDGGQSPFAVFFGCVGISVISLGKACFVRQIVSAERIRRGPPCVIFFYRAHTGKRNMSPPLPLFVLV